MGERKYCGKSWKEMNEILNVMCETEDKYDLSADELEAFDIAIQCMATVINRMVDNKPITWD